MASLAFVTCLTDADVLARCLLRSPCLAAGRYPLAIWHDSPSAADAFNREIAASRADWLVWVHQDVFLPAGWDERFLAALTEAERRWPHLAVAGVYGVAGADRDFVRAGHVIDRGQELNEPAGLPAEVSSLDELLVAVRVDSGLRFDPALKFDFYGTDIVLAAQAAGRTAVVVDATCEHHSGTPAAGAMKAATIARIKDSAGAFERKWAARLPIATPCFLIRQAGDTGRFIDTHFQPEPSCHP